MDSIGAARTVIGMKQENLFLNIQAGIMKKSMDSKTQTMEKLLDALPAQQVNPPHMGQKIDIKA